MKQFGIGTGNRWVPHFSRVFCARSGDFGTAMLTELVTEPAQVRSGERMQPTAQAVGSREAPAQAPEGRKKTPYPQDLPIEPNGTSDGLR